MRKCPIILAILSSITVVGSVLAYKASRITNTFYLDTITIIGGAQRSVCTVPTTYDYEVNPAGNRTIKASTASINVTCPVISVIPSA